MKRIVMNKETIDLKVLSYFVETANTLSFTQAAENLQVPKSVVSKAIQKLEQQLGLKVLERSSRAVRLTEAGDILYSRAISLLNDATHLVSDVQNLQKKVSGHLRLAAPPALGRYLSENLIPLYLNAWPDVKVSLKLSYDYEDLFKAGLDLAFRMGKNKDQDLIEKTLGFANRVIVATPGYLAKHPSISEPEHLESHQSLQVFDREKSIWTLVKDEQLVQVNLDGTFQCSDMDALKSVLCAGVGLAKLPWLVVREDIKSGKLVHVLKGWHSTGLPISAVYREGLHKPPKLAAFMDVLDEQTELFDLAFLN